MKRMICLVILLAAGTAFSTTAPSIRRACCVGKIFRALQSQDSGMNPVERLLVSVMLAKSKKS